MSSPARTPRSKRAKRGRNTEDPTSPQNGNQTPSTRNSQSAPTTPSSSSKKSRKSDMSSPPSRRRRRGGKMDTSPGADLMSLPPSSPAGEQQVQGSLSPSSPAPFRTGFTTSEIDLSSPLNYGTPNSRDDGPRTPRTPGIGSTPIRQRPDIRSDRKMRQVDLTGSDGGGNLCLSREPARTCRWSDPEHHWCRQVQLRGRGYCQQQQDLSQRMATKADRRMGIISNKTPPDHCPEDGFIDCVVLKEQDASHISSDISMDGPQLVIWGTDVVVSRCKEKFRRFVQRFVEEEVDCDERFEGMDVQEPYYLQRLDEINVTGEPFLCINSDHLRQFDADLYRQLVSYPQEVIPTFDMAVNEMFFDRFPNTILEHQIQVRPYNTEKTKNMRGLNPQDIDLLITIYGMVIRTSNLVPEMREGFFRCYACGNSQTVEIDRGRIAEPYLCTNCNTNHSFALVHNRSQFSDKQIVKLQESPEDMPPGQTPHTVLLYAHGDLVDKVQPGDRVTVTGIYRATPLRVNPRQRNVKSVYKTHIDIVHFRKTDVKRLHEHSDEQDRKDSKLSPERIELLKELSKSPDIYEKLARSIAPSIYENDDIKKGILLQLFGGCRKDFSNTGRGNFRSEINILLCGDPGTSKSQFLQYVHNLVPRGQYTSGKGSSAVGLTAYVTRDPETRQLVLQTGALVLSDNGVCCIDEFDKMTENTRSVLHEVMEQQTMSIAKAGIICSLNARTSILAAANPVESQWNKNKTITENIMLPHTLLSRFDLIFLILDPQDEFFDRRLASHLVSLYFKSQDEAKEDFMNTGTLKDYIAYARQCVNPVISEEAGQHFIQAYVDMRKVGSGRGQISAYPRQLESLIRLAEAHARMRFSEIVELADVEEAQRLYKEALKQAAVDPSTGKIDITILTTGISGAARKRRAEVTQALKKLIQAKGKVPTLKYQKLFEDFRGTSDLPVTREMFEESLRDLQDDDFLVVTSKIIRLCA